MYDTRNYIFLDTTQEIVRGGFGWNRCIYSNLCYKEPIFVLFFHATPLLLQCEMSVVMDMMWKLNNLCKWKCTILLYMYAHVMKPVYEILCRSLQSIAYFCTTYFSIWQIFSALVIFMWNSTLFADFFSNTWLLKSQLCLLLVV